MDKEFIKQVNDDIWVIRQILDSGILEDNNAKILITQGAFTLLIIHLRDLLAKADKVGVRVNFTDNLSENKKIKKTPQDITDHI